MGFCHFFPDHFLLAHDQGGIPKMVGFMPGDAFRVGCLVQAPLACEPQQVVDEVRGLVGENRQPHRAGRSFLPGVHTSRCDYPGYGERSLATEAGCGRRFLLGTPPSSGPPPGFHVQSILISNHVLDKRTLDVSAQPQEILAVADILDDGAPGCADRACPRLCRRALHLHIILKGRDLAGSRHFRVLS